MTPVSILSTSKNFHRGFELCYGNGLPANNGVLNAIIPAIVCLAFSIELGFKAILVGCNKPSDGHKFVELFGKLPPAIQVEIERLVVGEDSGFKSRLTMVSNVFVEWRYLFEEAGYHSIDIEFLSKLHDAVTKIAERYVSEQRAKLLAAKA